MPNTPDNMDKTLKIITLSSPLHGNADEINSGREILPALRSHFKTTLTSYKDLTDDKLNGVNDKYDITAVFIATGGTEELFLRISKYLPKPIIILSDSYHNSLAASLEIGTWLYNNNHLHKHIVFPVEPSHKVIDDLIEQIDNTGDIQNGFKRLSEERIGLIGGESAWLISSKIDRNSVTEMFGVTFTDINTEDIINDFKNFHDRSEHLKEESYLKEKIARYASKLEIQIDEQSLKDALAFYVVLNDVCRKNNLTSLTIKCFDILSPCNTTACLALAILNDQGIVSGCEGDIPSLWSMILAKTFCNSASFMANPSSVERVDKSIDFAHCTIPLSLSEGYSLTSHYESKKGIGIKADIPLGKYTLFKCGGLNLERFYIFEGEVIQNTSVAERCRTQIKFTFKSDDDMDDFMCSYLGNHTILIPGKHKKRLKSVMSLINKMRR